MSNTPIPPHLEEQIQKEYPHTKEYLKEKYGEDLNTDLCHIGLLTHEQRASARFGVSIALQQQWIPVTKQLPDKDGDYIVCMTSPTGNEVRVLCFFRDDDETIMWLNERSFAYKYEITHWMPLPEPPKE